jgi:IS6 family transposase
MKHPLGIILVMQIKSSFEWRHFEAAVILRNVKWCRRHHFSYRDFEEMMRDIGLVVDQVTVFRLIQRYSPEVNKRIRPHLKFN